MLDQQYETVRLDQLSQHPDNPHRGDTELIKESIDRHGFYGAVVAQRSTGRVLTGNHRLLAAQQHGMDELPVIFVDVDDNTAKRIMLVDNRSTEQGSWQFDELSELLSELREAGDGLDVLGWSDDELKGIIADADPLPEPEYAERLTYKVVVDCDDEDHQRSVNDALEADGYRVRRLTS